MPGAIQLEELTKSFGEHVAVGGIDVEMPAGEFFTLLGPSGCGKTTTLLRVERAGRLVEQQHCARTSTSSSRPCRRSSG